MKVEINFLDFKQNVKIKQLIKKVIKSSTDEISFCKKMNLELSVLIVSSRQIKSINKKYRMINKPTNVLAFPQIEENDFDSINNLKTSLIGDIVISPGIIKKESNDYFLGFNDHFSHILVHGLLHLFGYDHKNSSDTEIMQKKEISILEKINIKNPYYVINK
tara:strand:+ start:198 stop:683 length:486 start_codon:yes stop_codon:yes gene_type:complete